MKIIMRFQQVTDNGNVAVENPERGSHRKLDNKIWITSNNSNSTNFSRRTEHYPVNANCNIYNANEISEGLINYTTGNNPGSSDNQTNVEVHSIVCNKQYIINSGTVGYAQSNNTDLANLEGTTETGRASCESFLAGADVQDYSETSQIDEERAFELSDTDEMSEKVVQTVPRGIINPNYPGFQHLAHTLQDYSSNLDNFYHSENDMTDDDIDVEITDLNYEIEPNENESVDYKNINNNNNNNCKSFTSNLTSPQSGLITENKIFSSNVRREIPDLLKNVTKNINVVDSHIYDSNCTDTDIENNFHTKEIIGDFNKEIEDEIKLLLNYNINIQDDLEELRKDINDSFAKPIETTINNISDVVNHVIKKLVETQCESSDTPTVAPNEKSNDENDDIIKDNELNTRMEKNLNRPTFLLLEKNINDKISDAFLSDGKEEINMNDYDPEKISVNVENTIKQLSTELRKIIPKLDEMRERDKMWDENKKDSVTITTDANLNEISCSSSSYNFISTLNAKEKEKKDVPRNNYNESHTIKNKPLKSQFESRGVRERPNEQTCSNAYIFNAQRNKSVRKDASAKDYDELDSFDVYNIETALPKLDLDAIENHLKAAKEAERRKRNDREEIRRRLAMGSEPEEYYSMGHTDRPGKKPSLHSRLQSGMNLQICFMNETASDNETDFERNLNSNTKNLSRSSIFSKTNNYNHPYQTRPLSVNITKHDKISTAQSGAKLRPTSLMLKNTKSRSTQSLGHIELKESDFYALQATLQTEARIALAQAKEMARIQMERSRLGRVSPVTEMLRCSVAKAGAPLPPDRRRVSRQLLTDMNIAQLQVIVNELHSQIESLNDTLVKLLMARDELHMGQDSMLVDIEDLTRYLGVKEQTKKTKGAGKTGMKRLTSLVTK